VYFDQQNRLTGREVLDPLRAKGNKKRKKKRFKNPHTLLRASKKENIHRGSFEISRYGDLGLVWQIPKRTIREADFTKKMRCLGLV